MHITSKRKPVLVELKIKMIVDVPESWEQSDVEFWLNESSHCIGTEITELAWGEALANDNGCCDSCGKTEASVVSMTPTADEIQHNRPGAFFEDSPTNKNAVPKQQQNLRKVHDH